MERIDGLVPPDVMPYNFGDSWLYDASAADQRRLQDATVDVLAELHRLVRRRRALRLPRRRPGQRRHAAAPAPRPDDGVVPRGAPGTDQRSSVIERCLAWLEDRLPASTRATPSCPGAIRGSATACTATSRRSACSTGRWPASAPASSTCAGSRTPTVCSRTSPRRSRPVGCPTSSGSTTSSPATSRRTGVALRDLEWFSTYAAVQFAIVFLRTGQRQVHFGEKERPADADELVMNAAAVESMLAGTYW